MLDYDIRKIGLDFLIATHNINKRDELQRILQPLGISVRTADELGVTLREVDETGATFEENAALKARGGCADSGLPCIADDSGLEVDALGGRPGVHTARYGGGEQDYEKKMALLLNELKDVPEGERTARFVSVICCTFPDGREFCVRGVCEGAIGLSVSGNGGFGFDPCFYVGGKSFADCTAAEKDAISHRGNALRALVNELPQYFSNEPLPAAETARYRA
jgi:XTP/dITP diphosphohydrolase